MEETKVPCTFLPKLGYLGDLLIYLGGVVLVNFNICILSVLGILTYTEAIDEAKEKKMPTKIRSSLSQVSRSPQPQTAFLASKRK